ncbi:MAG: type VI secretion system baseplate subunit TssE [Maritimibacter sp.]
MATADRESPDNDRRLWRREDRAKVTIMQVFRASHHAHDSRRASEKTEAGDGQITERARMRREGVSEDELRRLLQDDLASLMNTVQLDAATPLEDAEHVKHSILNYGFRDLSSVAAKNLTSPAIIASIRQSLIDHEPRLIPSSINVQLKNDEGGVNQRLALHIEAEMMGDPVDVPLDFDAEVDLGAGKLSMSKMRISR